MSENGTPPTVDPEQPLTVTLQAQQWNVVLSALNDVPLPFRMTAPVMQSLHQQLFERAGLSPPAAPQGATGASGPMAPTGATGNGVDHGAERPPDRVQRPTVRGKGNPAI